MQQQLRNIKGVIIVLWIIVTVLSCSKWDDYRKYTETGEIVYPGKLDSVKALSGKNRVRIAGKLNADPKISALKIFWNKGADSLTFDIKRGATGSVFEQTFSMPEGVITFTVYTYDASGNRSVPVTVVGKSFGDAYRRSLTNRFITSLTYNAAKDSTTINWDVVLPTVQYTEVKYPGKPNGDTVTVKVLPAGTQTGLTGFDFQTTRFTYKTIYKPDSTSIDTFATPSLIR